MKIIPRGYMMIPYEPYEPMYSIPNRNRRILDLWGTVSEVTSAIVEGLEEWNPDRETDA